MRLRKRSNRAISATKHLANLNFNKQTYYAIAIFLALTIPIGYVHEIGHALVCDYEHLDHKITIKSFGITTKCSGQPQNFTLFTASGGVLASLVSITMFALIPYRPAKIALVSLAVIHAVNALVETFLYNSYRQNPQMWSIILNTLNIAVFILFIKLYEKPKLIPKQTKCLNDI